MTKLRSFLMSALLVGLVGGPAWAEDAPAVKSGEKESKETKEPKTPGEKKPGKVVEMNEAEQAFAKLLTGADLVGSFTADGRSPSPKQDRYTIAKAEKVKGEKWLIHSRVKYGTVDVVVPVPVNVNWAGETAVLSLKNLSIPLLGDDFGACILFEGDRYAGTWSHGKVGGHMWGKTERAKTEDVPKEPGEAEKKPMP
jgi:hypothetical protein